MTDAVPAANIAVGTFFVLIRKMYKKILRFSENMLQKPTELCKIYIMKFWFSGRLPNGNFAKHP